ncbi:MAG: Vitamin B12 ABC transporter, permease component BtuC [Anaerolineae bacterium]|nr:MAG: Vitamin B12 ABC transporter, permease component BtuC [Anaerolineae bacterium]
MKEPSTLPFWSARPYLVSSLAFVLALFFSVVVGAVWIPPQTMARLLAALAIPLDLSDVPPAYQTIVHDVRLPHAILMALTGAALASSGAAYQGLFRNPLADPYLIGVASGAGLGAVIALALRWPATLGGWLVVPVAAFGGALLTVLIVYRLARVNQSLPTTTLILAGVAVSSFATALTSFIMLRSRDELHRALAWLLGGSTVNGWMPVWAAFPYIIGGFLVLWSLSHVLNVLQFGEEQAHQLGIRVERAKLWLILAASLTTAAAVSFSGLIGFIGLIVPHTIRLLWGPDYRRLLPLSALGGACALLLADLLARVALAPQVLPVGVVTALAGAPFFLWLLRRAKSEFIW